MSDPRPPAPEPSLLVIDLFRVLEDLHDITQAITVLLTDEDGVAVAVSGDEADVPASLRAVLSRRQLRAAGSVRALLEPLDNLGSTNVTILAVDDAHVLSIVFDAEADLLAVQEAGGQARDMLRELLASAN